MDSSFLREVNQWKRSLVLLSKAQTEREINNNSSRLSNTRKEETQTPSEGSALNVFLSRLLHDFNVCQIIPTMNPISRPVSDLIKSRLEDAAGEDDGSGKFKTREEWRKAKELEEARKAGTAPAAVDEEGKDINPHIPQYISSAPWYINSRGPTLKHQRQPSSMTKSDVGTIHDYYQRGVKLEAASKYRKGACENCGAVTHKRKDCLERPRKTGAKYSNDSIAPDEKLLPDLKLDYDGKRDRWAGFDASMYKTVVDEYEKVEEAKRILKEEKMKQDLINIDSKHPEAPVESAVGPSTDPSADPTEETTGVESDGESEDEDEKYADHVDMPGTKVDSKQRITVRNLRIREDVAKYLRNLDPDSAYYDPKTRAMRDDPYKNASKKPPDVYAGENFVRYSGDTMRVMDAQKFAWQAQEKGLDVHLMAEPTKAELLHKEFKVKSTEIKESVKQNILEKYGGQEHLDVPPPQLIFAQTEEYIEYSRQGKIVKGNQKAPVKSIYEEDIHLNNHTSVWGSFWTDGSWGYKCCHSLIKNSYCTGARGQEAVAAGALLLTARDDDDPNHTSEQKPPVDFQAESKRDEDDSSQIKKDKKKRKKRKGKKKKRRESSSSSSESSISSEDETSDGLNVKKLKAAIEREKEQKRDEETDERKRKYNSMYEIKAPTEEEIEAFRLTQQRSEDPMSQFMK